MGCKRTSGLIRRGGIWHIDKQIRGHRIRESTGESELAKAEEHLARRREELRQRIIYGERQTRTFREAATRYLEETVKRSLWRDAHDLRLVDPYIGQLALEQVHMGTLQTFVQDRQQAGIKSATVNRTLGVVRQILNRAARLWRDDQGRPWLATAPMIQMQDWEDARQPYPLSWEEQDRLLRILPGHLQRMALFALNTGLRQEELCGLKWAWEEQFGELDTFVFVIPASCTKNRQDRVVPLNSVARSLVDERRGQHPEYVFTYRGHRVGRIYNSAWKRARQAAGLPHLRVHDLRHTFGRRLRAVGVPHETRKDLLGHKSGDVTTHYSPPELRELIEAVEKLCGKNPRKTPTMTLLKSAGVRVSD